MAFSVTTLRQLNRVMSTSEKIDLVRMMISTEENRKAMIELIGAEPSIHAHVVGVHQAKTRAMFDEADPHPMGRAGF